MANIILTNHCNAHCTFCFAQNLTEQKTEFLSLDALEQRIQYLKKSNIQQLRLMGGEPTLHPEFAKIIQLGVDAGLQIILFSNGYIPEKALMAIDQLSDEECALLINVNAVTKSTGKTNRLHVYKTLSKKITLGYTILAPVFDLDSVFESIENFNLQSKVRLGLALPAFDGSNHFLNPNKYSQAASSIIENARIGHQRGIHLEFDCGFVQCMFTDHQKELLADFGTNASYHCAPNLDIGIDDSIFHCFCLDQLKVDIKDVDSLVEAKQKLLEKRQAFRGVGIYPYCSSCENLINDTCTGGCLSLTLQRSHTATNMYSPKIN